MSAATAESKTSYILDKLQSLSGVIPIGAYLVDHLWSNSYALVSVEKYNQVSGDLQTVPWRIAVEAAVLWISTALSQPLRLLYLVEGEVQRAEPSLDVELDVRAATLERDDRIRVYRLAPLHRAISADMASLVMPVWRRTWRTLGTWPLTLSESSPVRFTSATDFGILPASGELRSLLRRNVPLDGLARWWAFRARSRVS